MRYRQKPGQAWNTENSAPADISPAEPRPLVIIGAGMILHDIIRLVRENSAFNIQGILDPDPGLWKRSISGLPVLGWLDILTHRPFAAAIGTAATPDAFDRASVFQLLVKQGIRFPILISSACRCARDAVIHQGALLLSDSQIGRGAIISSNCLIAAGAHVGDFVSLKPHTVVMPGETISRQCNRASTRIPPNLVITTASEQESIQELVRKLNASPNDIVLITDTDGILRGTVTDGDIRRGILAGIGLQSPASTIMNCYPVSAPVDTPYKYIVDIMRRKGIRHIPIVDKRGRPVRLQTMKEIIEKELPNDAVIMAGGMGTRLRPLTYQTPKPLLHVGGKPILDHILGNLRTSGIRDVAISLNYMGDFIRDHVGSGRQFDLNVNYLTEFKRLGTGGALTLMRPRPTHPFLVMNGDLLVKLNFAKLFAFQKKGGYRLVMGVRCHKVKIPYGVVEVSGEKVAAIREKPEQDIFINSGIYVVDPRCIDSIPPDKFFDMPDLIRVLLDRGDPVGAFPIIEYWRDIGTPEDLKTASQEHVSRSAAERPWTDKIHSPEPAVAI